jgi:hypothetical protein
MSDNVIQQTMMGHGFSDQMNKSMDQNRNALRKSERFSFFKKSSAKENNDLVAAGKKMNKSEFMAFSANLKREQRLYKTRMLIIFTLIFTVLTVGAVAMYWNFSETWTETHNQGPHFQNNDRENGYE